MIAHEVDESTALVERGACVRGGHFLRMTKLDAFDGNDESKPPH